MTPVLHDVSAARRCWVMFWAYFRITALVIGGGYAIIAAAQEEFVTRRKWLTEDDMVEMLTITQTVPGILACNSAIYVGWRIGGLAGAVAAMIGAVVPSLLIITLSAAGLKCVESFLDESAVRGAFTGIIGSIVGMVAVTAIKMRRKTVTGWVGGGGPAAACWRSLALPSSAAMLPRSAPWPWGSGAAAGWTYPPGTPLPNKRCPKRQSCPNAWPGAPGR